MRKNTRLLFTLLGLILSSNSFAQVSLENGNAFYDYFQFKEAIKEYEFALKNNRTTQNEAHILKRLAYSYLYTFQYARSEAKFRELVLLGDKKADPNVYLDYGNLLKIQDKYNKALDQFNYYKTIKKSDSYSEFLLRSLNWAIKNKDSVRTKTFVGVTNIDVSGQSLGYCFFDDGLIYAQAKDTNYNEFTTLFDLAFITMLDSVTFTHGDDVVSDINFPFNEGSPCLTSDGETLYFTATGAKVKEGEVRKSGRGQTNADGISNLRLYSSKLENGKFSIITELPFNDKNYNHIHPTISADGNTLYFVSDMPGGYGGLDIYKSIRNGDGTWTTPINLGEKVNTTEQEVFPFLLGDKLYFSSKGHLGFGGYDIFVSTIGNKVTYSNPQNIGKPYNSSKDDIAYIAEKDGITGYLSSNRDSDNGIDKVYYFNSNYVPMPFKAYVPLADTVKVALAKVEPALELNEVKQLAVKKNVVNSPSIAKNILPKLDTAPVKLAKAEPTFKKVAVKKVTIKLEEDKAVSNVFSRKMILVTNGYFIFNSSNLPSDLSSFNEVIEKWNEDKTAKIKIIASTDCRGSESYNLALSNKRAASAKNYFTQNGVPLNKISAIGVGEYLKENNCEDCNTCNEEMHSANRKVQLILSR
jgi:outer membrane protein OmpA-like peptidoglycan-associated protein/tetratricopeptide (TPR) repeat protein